MLPPALAQSCSIPNTGADDPATNPGAVCDGIVDASEIGDYIQRWYACSSCVQDIYNAMAEFFAVCGDNTCNFNEDCSSCQQDCGSCSTPGTSFPHDFVAYWKFEGDTIDETGVNDGTIVGNPQFVNGKHGQALDFSGSGEYVTVPVANSPLNITGDQVTIMAWINYSVGVNVALIAGVEENAGPPYGNQYKIFMRDADSGRFFVGTTNGLGGCNGNVNFPANTWTHVAAVYDGASATLYIDGIVDISVSQTGNITSNGEDFGIGGGAAGSTEFNGLIDEVMVYNRSLNQSEIQQIIDATGKCLNVNNCQQSMSCMNLMACDPQQAGGHDYYDANGCGYDYASQVTGCDDNSACTNNDACDGSGNCTGTTVTCDDSVACTDDSCNPSSGCVYALNNANCGSGMKCDAQQGCIGDPCAQITDCSHYTDQTNCSSNSCGVTGYCAWNAGASTCEKGSWVAPVGIPYPDFGITEDHYMYELKSGEDCNSHPDKCYDYGTGTLEQYKDAGNGPYTHYIDNTHPNSTNTNNVYGTPGKPRLSIPRRLPAGSIAEVHGGPYSYSTLGGKYLRQQALGTQIKPVFIRGIGMPRFDKKIEVYDLGGNSYLILEDLEVRAAMIGAPSDHIAIRNCDFNGGGITVHRTTESGNANPNNTASNIVLYNNNIHDVGNMYADYDQDYHGIGVMGYVQYLWVVDNEMYRTSGNGIQINAGQNVQSQTNTHHIYVGRNKAHHNKQAAVWAKQSVDVIFSQNELYGSRQSSSGAGDGAGGQYSPERVWYIFNNIYDNDNGMRLSDSYGGFGQDVYFIGNLVYDIHHNRNVGYNPIDPWSLGKGIVFYSATQRNKHIIGNTIYDVDGGIHIGANTAAPLLMYNNIIGNVNIDSGTPNDIHLHHDTTAGTSVLYNNLFDNPATIKWGYGSPKSGIAAFEAANPSKSGGNQEGNTQLVNVPAFSIRLVFFEYLTTNGILNESNGKTTLTVIGEDFNAMGVRPNDKIAVTNTPNISTDWGVRGESLGWLRTEAVNGDTITLTRDITINPQTGVQFRVFYYPLTHDEFYLDDSSRYQIGDILEYDHDDVPRTITNIEQNAMSDSVVSKDRIVFNPPLSAPVRPITSISNWQSNTDLTWDLRLKSGSSAIDTGMEHSAFQLFYSLYGINITHDYYERVRPQDGDNSGTAEWDIGAYEY
jgi:hypothetical protein